MLDPLCGTTGLTSGRRELQGHTHPGRLIAQATLKIAGKRRTEGGLRYTLVDMETPARPKGGNTGFLGSLPRLGAWDLKAASSDIPMLDEKAVSHRCVQPGTVAELGHSSHWVQAGDTVLCSLQFTQPPQPGVFCPRLYLPGTRVSTPAPGASECLPGICVSFCHFHFSLFLLYSFCMFLVISVLLPDLGFH